MYGLLLLRECNHCGGVETRIFTDSWTGTELCINCIAEVINHVTFDPEEEEAGPAGLLNAINTILPIDKEEV